MARSTPAQKPRGLASRISVSFMIKPLSNPQAIRSKADFQTPALPRLMENFWLKRCLNAGVSLFYYLQLFRLGAVFRIAEALLFPGAGIVVIAAHFPETGAIFCMKFDTGNPCCTLPGIPFGHHHP